MFEIIKNFIINLCNIEIPGIGISLGAMFIAIIGLPILLKAVLSVFGSMGRSGFKGED